MKPILLALASLLLAGSASAQSPTITGLTVTVQNAAGVQVAPGQTAVWPPTGAAGSCNLAPTPNPVGTVINPQFVELTDPLLVGRACRVAFGVYFASLPTGTGYKATAVFQYSDGVAGGVSNATLPFDLQVVRAVPQTLGVR